MSAQTQTGLDFMEHSLRKEYEKMILDSENRLRGEWKDLRREDHEKMISDSETRLRSEWKDAEVRFNATCMRMENRIDKLDEKIDGLDKKFDRKIDDFRKEVKGEFDGFRKEVKDDFDRSRKWSIGIVAMIAVGFISVIGGLIGVIVNVI